MNVITTKNIIYNDKNKNLRIVLFLKYVVSFINTSLRFVVSYVGVIPLKSTVSSMINLHNQL